jgi:hypothetical protein
MRRAGAVRLGGIVCLFLVRSAGALGPKFDARARRVHARLQLLERRHLTLLRQSQKPSSLCC